MNLIWIYPQNTGRGSVTMSEKRMHRLQQPKLSYLLYKHSSKMGSS